MANVRLPTINPLVLRFLLDDVPGWLNEFLKEQIGQSDQAGRALFLAIIRRRHDGYLLDLRFREATDRPDSPALRDFLAPLAALPLHTIEASEDKPLSRDDLQLLSPPEPGKGTGTVIREKQTLVPRRERGTTLFPTRPE